MVKKTTLYNSDNEKLYPRTSAECVGYGDGTVKDALDSTGVGDYPAFSASTAYSAGDVVNYNGKLYKFTADHAAGAWTGSDVEDTDVVKAHIVQELGDSEDKAVSQKAVKKELDTLKYLEGLVENNDGNFSIVDGDGNIVLRIDEDGLKAFVLNIMNADEKVGVIDAVFFQGINNIIPKEKEVNILIASQSFKIGENAGIFYYIPIDVEENDILRIELVHTDSVWPQPIILYKDLSDEENVQTIYDRSTDGTGTGIIKEVIVDDTYKYIRLASSVTTTLIINVYKVENRVTSDTTENADKISNIQSVYHIEDHMVMGGENPLSLIKETPGLCGIIHDWGFIGDSLSSGTFTPEPLSDDETDQTYTKSMYDYSWGQIMCKLCGTKGTNFSVAGYTSKSWIEQFWDADKKGFDSNGESNETVKNNLKQAYIIALGVNDYRSVTLGSSDDVSMDDYNQNGSTFYGNMAGIIQRLRSISPFCKIFMVTIPRVVPENAGFNDAIRWIASQFDNTYLIDLAKYGEEMYRTVFYEEAYTNGGHMSPAGYQFTAYVMMTYIDWIIRNNPNEFRAVSYINVSDIQDKIKYM